MKNPISLARKLRKTLTDAERKLWQILRSRRLGGFRFRRQVPLGNYILDFACFDPCVVIEVDGGQHNDIAMLEYDKQRTKWLESRGYFVLRFWNNQVLQEIEGVAQIVLSKCLSLKSPHPNLPPEGEGTLRLNFYPGFVAGR